MNMLLDMPPVQPKHPAKFTDSLLPVFVEMLTGATRILDPFGGTGKLFLLEHWLPGAELSAVEIEPEWCDMHPKTTLGNALALPWPDDYFDAVITSCTYGNRMADSFDAKDSSYRATYTHVLGRKLHPDNSGQLQWGNAYRDFHVKAWTEARRVLQSGGRMVLNCKDHIRAGQRQHVTQWHIDTLTELGFALVEHRKIETPSMRNGANAKLRIPYESIILFRLNGAGTPATQHANQKVKGA